MNTQVCEKLCQLGMHEVCQILEPENQDGTPLDVSNAGHDYRYQEICRHWACVNGERAARDALRWRDPDENGLIAFGTEDDKPTGRFVDPDTHEVYSTRQSDGMVLKTGQKIR